MSEIQLNDRLLIDDNFEIFSGIIQDKFSQFKTWLEILEHTEDDLENSNQSMPNGIELRKINDTFTKAYELSKEITGLLENLRLSAKTSNEFKMAERAARTHKKSQDELESLCYLDEKITSYINRSDSNSKTEQRSPCYPQKQDLLFDTNFCESKNNSLVDSRIIEEEIINTYSPGKDRRKKEENINKIVEQGRIVNELALEIKSSIFSQGSYIDEMILIMESAVKDQNIVNQNLEQALPEQVRPFCGKQRLLLIFIIIFAFVMILFLVF